MTGNDNVYRIALSSKIYESEDTIFKIVFLSLIFVSSVD